MSLNLQAQELNDAIRAVNPTIFEMLSERGKRIYFPKMGILSQSAEAKGKEINATIGTALEDNGSPMVLDSIHQYVSLPNKEFYNYAPSFGRPEIRKIWKEMLVKKNPSLNGFPISLPVVTCALTHGLSMAAYLFVNEGDEIIMPDLYWENYDLIFDLAYGGSISTFPTFANNSGFNIEGLRSKLSSGKGNKKIVLLNFPNNPTGYTASETEAEQIYQVLLNSAQAGNKIVVLIDDAYFGLVFEDGIARESLFAKLANAHENILAVKFDGPTKEDYVWGFRVGFVTFGAKGCTPALYNALESKLAGTIRGNISNASNLGQSLLLEAYSSEQYDKEKDQKYLILKKRYSKVKEILSSNPQYKQYFEALPFNSGYFMCVKINGADAETVRQKLLATYSTGLIAQGPILRIAFSATPFDKIEKLFSNLYSACKDVQQ